MKAIKLLSCLLVFVFFVGCAHWVRLPEPNDLRQSCRFDLNSDTAQIFGMHGGWQDVWNIYQDYDEIMIWKERYLAGERWDDPSED